MSRIIQHNVPEGTGVCTICGTTNAQIAVGFTCIWRDVPDAKQLGDVRPEPALRYQAHEDGDAIMEGLARLKKERTDAMNYVEEEKIIYIDTSGMYC